MTATEPRPADAPATTTAQPAPMSAPTSTSRVRRALGVWLPPFIVLLAAIGIWYLYSTWIGETERKISLPYFHDVVDVAFLDGENRSELFDAVTVERMQRALARILRAAADDPDRLLTELVRPAAAERHQLLVEWNDTARDDREECLHVLFGRQVARAPDALAAREMLVWEEETPTHVLDMTLSADGR